MTLTITGTTITSDQNPHTARLAPGCQHIWQASWLPGEVLDRNSAITAMLLADIAGKGDLHEGHRLWPHIESWAAELGLTGPDAIARASQPARGLDPGQERASRQPDRRACLADQPARHHLPIAQQHGTRRPAPEDATPAPEATAEDEVIYPGCCGTPRRSVPRRNRNRRPGCDPQARAGWKFRLSRTGPRQPALAGAEQEIIHSGNQMRPAPEPEPEVADHELALMAAEFLSGAPYPDLEDAAEVAAWRAEHADLLSKGPEAVMEQADAREAEFDEEAEREEEGGGGEGRRPNRTVSKPIGSAVREAAGSRRRA